MSNTADAKTYALFQTPLNKKIIAEMTRDSAKLFLFPALETERVKLNVEETVLIQNIIGFDWLIFTDVLAVDYFLELLTENEIDFYELDAVRVCAFGEIVADRLRFAQIHADVVPTEINAAKIFAAIKVYAGENELGNLKMLLVKEDSADFEIKNLLVAAKVELTELPVYTAKISAEGDTAKLKTLLKGGAIDEFIFSAPDDLIALRHYFPNENELNSILEEVKATAIDANIFQNLKENCIKARYFAIL